METVSGLFPNKNPRTGRLRKATVTATAANATNTREGKERPRPSPRNRKTDPSIPSSSYPPPAAATTTTTAAAPSSSSYYYQYKTQQQQLRQIRRKEKTSTKNTTFWRQVIKCLLLLCPLSFVTSLILSSYLLTIYNNRHHNSTTTTTTTTTTDSSQHQYIRGPADLNNLFWNNNNNHSQYDYGQWIPDKLRDLLPSLWWVNEIDLRQWAMTLSFENIDGGVWKQGWELDPVPIGGETTTTTLQIVVVPHSHVDPGWIKTMEQYYDTQVRYILNTVVTALDVDPRRTFIWAEVCFLEKWWSDSRTTDEHRQAFRRIVNTGQFEIVSGGWVQPDEANAQLYALEIQLQEGHDWIRQTLGDTFVPTYAWSIDTFGHSPTMAYLYKKYNMTAMVIQRVHYAIKKELAKRQHLEFYWRQTWEEEEKEHHPDDGPTTPTKAAAAATAKVGQYDIWTHVLPFFSYDISHSW
jgi:hypothetical protein